jgi:hypothetical protein
MAIQCIHFAVSYYVFEREIILSGSSFLLIEPLLIRPQSLCLLGVIRTPRRGLPKLFLLLHLKSLDLTLGKEPTIHSLDAGQSRLDLFEFNRHNSLGFELIDRLGEPRSVEKGK